MIPIQSSRLRQIFSDVVVAEAAEPATIVVTPDDVAHGIPGDPHQCAFALACRRAWGGNRTDVAFLRTVAYVTFTDRDGRRQAERFVMPTPTRKLVQIFDEGGELVPGDYKLNPPAPSQTVKAGYERATAQRTAAKAKRRKLKHKPRGPHDPLSFKRLTAFRTGRQWPTPAE